MTIQKVEDKVDILMATHNNLMYTMWAVDCIYKYTGVPFRLTLIDDSTDLTPTWAYRFHGENDNFTMIHSDEPYKCVNQVINIGLKNTDSEFVVFLGNSTIVEPNWLDEAFRIMKRAGDVGVIGFKELFPNGTIEHAGIHFEPGMPHHVNYGVGEPSHRCTWVTQVPAVGWCLVLLRRAAIPREGLEEDYYFGWRGYDDLDNCFTLHKNGWTILYCGLGTAYHYAQVTKVGQTDEEITNYIKEDGENRFKFLARWGVPEMAH